MLRVVADENMPAVESLLGELAQVTRCNGRSLTSQQLGGADVLFVRSVTRVDSQLLQATPVRFVGTATSGTEHIDLDYLDSRGIGFTRAAGSNANSVVEYVLSALVALPDQLRRLMGGGSVGVVGQGPVGLAVANRLRSLGGRCLVYDPWLAEEQLEGSGSLAQVLACDLVCLHPELTRQQPWPSYHLLGERELEGMKGHQLVINASRGAVVDNLALRARLDRPDAPRVVLDVWEGEPKLDVALLESVSLGTAHIAGYSLDGKILATRMLCEAMARDLGVALPGQGVTAGNEPRYCSGDHLEGPSLVSHLMAQCYDIREDDRRLREACSPGEAIGAAFDQLRKHYPERRELAGNVVSGCSKSQEQTVRALGCIPE